jgi:hypothetical protein
MESGKLAIFAHSTADRVAGQKLLERLKGLAGKLTFSVCSWEKSLFQYLWGYGTMPNDLKTAYAPNRPNNSRSA